MALSFAFTDGGFPQIQDRIEPQKGALRYVIADITCDNSYPANGYAVTAANFGLNSIFTIVPDCTAGGVIWLWDNINSKLKGWKSPAGTNTPFVEIGGTDVNGLVLRCFVIGR